MASELAFPVSVRLDLESFGSLRRLEATGLSRSDAIRHALVAAADRLWEPEVLAAEAAQLMNDSVDRAEMRRLGAELDGLDEPLGGVSDASG